MIEGAQDEGLTPNRKALQDTAEQACLEEEGLCGAGRGWVLPEAGEAARDCPLLLWGENTLPTP